MTANQLEQLRGELGSPESLVTDLTGMDDYFHDATEFRAVPTGLLLADSTSDVHTAVNFCRTNSINIVARGAGTGLSGGCVATAGGLLLSTEKLCEMEISPQQKMAICGAGVIPKDLVEAAAAVGLTYPPDPASYDESTLGGNVAENAGGLRCKRFGVTKDYVIGLEVVLFDGSLLKTGIFNQNRGFSLGDLMIASEGTLGVITRIAVRLIEIPLRGETILVTFDHPREAAQTVSDITSAGIIPTVMEFLDGDAAACSNEYQKTEGLDGAGALLLMETSDIGVQSEQINSFCRKNNATFLRIESDLEKADELWRVRRNLSYAVKESGGYRISEDVAVPNSKFPDLVAFVAEMNSQCRLRLNSFGHAGDGNLHVNFIAPSNCEEDLAEIEIWVEKLMKQAIYLGGTLSGEHGIGLAKKKYLPLEFDPATLDTMRAVRRVFDPDGRLNPEKLFPDQ